MVLNRVKFPQFVYQGALLGERSLRALESSDLLWVVVMQAVRVDHHKLDFGVAEVAVPPTASPSYFYLGDLALTTKSHRCQYYV